MESYASIALRHTVLIYEDIYMILKYNISKRESLLVNICAAQLYENPDNIFCQLHKQLYKT